MREIATDYNPEELTGWERIEAAAALLASVPADHAAGTWAERLAAKIENVLELRRPAIRRLELVGCLAIATSGAEVGLPGLLRNLAGAAGLPI